MPPTNGCGFLRVDVEHSSGLAPLHQVTRIPTAIVVDELRKELEREIGPPSWRR